MSTTLKGMQRRDFLKGVAAAGLWSIIARVEADEPSGRPSDSTVPRRPFGRTGYSVPILALGGMFDIPNNQLILRRCLQAGVTYWDTADCYEGGRSEEGIGRFFAANSDARKNVFLVTKSDARDPANMTRLLNRSLERMQTDYIDLYCIHGVTKPQELAAEIKVWVENAKKRGQIRLFGFSTHANMADNLAAAAKLGWIDGIMFTYNYRLMNNADIKRAVDACSEAGIGLTAMKTQGGGPIRPDDAARRSLAAHFAAKGFSPEQAKLKAIWSNPQIASICSQMPNLRILTANIAAAVDRTELTQADFEQLQTFADATKATYCAGCTRICETAANLPLGDMMRCWMYENEYGLPGQAASEFARIMSAGRPRLSDEILSAAQAVCPQHLPVASLTLEAVRKWSADLIG